MDNVTPNQPSVSVVITTYNRKDYLRAAIGSVLAQSFNVYEIIVIDDCSPTPLSGVINEFSDQRIHYERLSENAGPNRARNRGVEIASGDWVAFLDDDDLWLPEKITRQMQYLVGSSRSQPWIGGVCSYRFLESDKDRIWGSTGKVDLDTLKSGNPYCGTSGLIVDRKVISQVKFDEVLPCGQDWDVFIRLSMLGDLIYLEEPLFLYRRGSHDSVTLKAKNLKLNELEARLASTYKHQDWLGDGPFRLRLASQTLAYFPHKKNRMAWIRKSIRLAGMSATLKVLLGKVRSNLSNTSG